MDPEKIEQNPILQGEHPLKKESKTKILGYIFFIFVAPILLLYYNVINLNWRIFLLIGVSIVIYFIIRQNKWRPHDYGLRIDNFRKSIIPYLIFIILGVLGIIYFAKMLGMAPDADWWTHQSFWLAFIVVSVLQEFAYRGFLMPILNSIFTDHLGVLLINALLFTLLHIIYPIPQIMLPMAFVAGIAFATMYIYRPNLILISIAHIILNFTAILFGFFVIYN